MLNTNSSLSYYTLRSIQPLPTKKAPTSTEKAKVGFISAKKSRVSFFSNRSIKVVRSQIEGSLLDDLLTDEIDATLPSNQMAGFQHPALTFSRHQIKSYERLNTSKLGAKDFSAQSAFEAMKMADSLSDDKNFNRAREWLLRHATPSELADMETDMEDLLPETDPETESLIRYAHPIINSLGLPELKRAAEVGGLASDTIIWRNSFFKLSNTMTFKASSFSSRILRQRMVGSENESC